MSVDTEKLHAADHAAQFLIRYENSPPGERAEYKDWLAESPMHVREALLAQFHDTLLRALFRSGVPQDVSTYL